nr:MAG TPA: hypothetical protein [Caudoviricetes sp.]
MKCKGCGKDWATSNWIGLYVSGDGIQKRIC